MADWILLFFLHAISRDDFDQSQMLGNFCCFRCYCLGFASVLKIVTLKILCEWLISQCHVSIAAYAHFMYEILRRRRWWCWWQRPWVSGEGGRLKQFPWFSNHQRTTHSHIIITALQLHSTNLICKWIINHNQCNIQFYYLLRSQSCFCISKKKNVRTFHFVFCWAYRFWNEFI